MKLTKCPNCETVNDYDAACCCVCRTELSHKAEHTGEETLRSSDVVGDMRRRVERAEDQILNATTKREKDHAIIRYETVRDILSAYERKAAMSPTDQAHPQPVEAVVERKGDNQ